jgi:holliday junction DNA helicase RuvA
MYTYIQGKVIHSEGIILSVLIHGTGIGFDILCSPTVLANRWSSSDDMHLWIHHHITEVNQVLFWFTSPSERSLFRELLRVNGIGGKTALALLGLGTEELIKAIHLEDDTLLSSVPWIGKKTAQKIIVDLKGSIDFSRREDTKKMAQMGNNTSLISTLVQMGYEKNRVTDIVESLEHEKTLEEKTKEAIRILSRW